MRTARIGREGRCRSSFNFARGSHIRGLSRHLRRLGIELLEDRRLLSLGPAAGPLEPFPFALPGELHGDAGGGAAKTIEPGQSGDGVVDLIVDTDGMTIDTDGVTITSYGINSAAGIFTGEPADNLGLFQADVDYEISGAMGFTLNGTHLLGDVIGEEFDGTDLFQDLRFTYTMEGPGPIYAGTLILASPEAGEMHGSLWDDVSADGVWDAGESTLAGWTVYLDADDDGTFDANERSMLTDADGQYAFLALAPGTYTVAEVVQPAWQQTFPAGDGRHTLTLAPGEHVMNVDFGNCSGGIRGAKWHDIDGDGLRDADEPGLEGQRIYLDLDLDGSWDADEPCTLTDADGQYAFRGLTGGTYTVAEVTWDYWEQTFPGGDGRHTVTVTPGQVVTDVDFGNRRIPGIHGVKWYDLDEDGVRDPGEPGVADWTIYLDANDNGQLDWGEPSTLTDRSGKYAVTGIASGTYTVTEVAHPRLGPDLSQRRRQAHRHLARGSGSCGRQLRQLLAVHRRFRGTRRRRSGPDCDRVGHHDLQ